MSFMPPCRVLPTPPCKGRRRAAAPQVFLWHCPPPKSRTLVMLPPFFLFPSPSPVLCPGSQAQGHWGLPFPQSKESSDVHSPFCLAASGSCSRQGRQPGAAATACVLWSLIASPGPAQTGPGGRARTQPHLGPHRAADRERAPLPAAASPLEQAGWACFMGCALNSHHLAASHIWSLRWRKMKARWGVQRLVRHAGNAPSLWAGLPTWPFPSLGCCIPWLEELSLCAQNTRAALDVRRSAVVRRCFHLYLQTVAPILFRDRAWINFNTFQRYWWWPNTERVQGI